MATTRAKMRCNSVKLMRSSYVNPKYAGVNYAEGRAKAEEDGEEYQIPFDQPTVELGVVAGDDSPENAAFWAATPMGTCQLTISNPDAAETFELGKHYYVDFTPAPA